MGHQVELVKFVDTTDNTTDVICVNRNSVENLLQGEAETFVRNWVKLTEETITDTELDNLIDTLERGEVATIGDYEIWIDKCTMFDGLMF